jgi:GTP-binding protein
MKDHARIHVVAGGGGNGCLSFRREAHVPKGGPDGGNGGHGGDVVLVCDDSMRDLERFRRSSHFKAVRAGHGQGSQRHGADGAVMEISVPPGTEVVVEETGARHDLTQAGQRAVVARGGSGGRGNRSFVGPTHQSPRFAERGLPGEESWIELQLKLLADAGLVGLPNAGKSSLLSRLTRAHPKVAAYPFTTLEPALGTLHSFDRQLVIADIPGLIEGASAGAGLGHEFLAHVERTRLLVHVLDVAPLDGSDPVANHATVEEEIALHDPRLAMLPRILVLSKIDLIDPESAARAQRQWQERLGGEVPVLLTSSVTRLGLEELTLELSRRIPLDTGEPAPAPALSPAQMHRAALAASDDPDGPGRAARELPEHRVFRPAVDRAYEITREGEHAFSVSGKGIERLVARYDLENEDALAHLERRLRGIGVIRALEAHGFQPGDDVEIAGIEFELDPNQ